MCFLWHKWSKWWDISPLVYLNVTTGTQRPIRRQERLCERCNLREVHEIDD